MRKRIFDRMVKKIHDINESVLSTPIIIKSLSPIEEQQNFNPILREWTGNRNWEVIAETTGIIEAFKESETWKEIGTLSVHDYKCIINDNLNIDYNNISHCIVERLDNGLHYEVVFYREFIGEVHLGLRPVIDNEF